MLGAFRPPAVHATASQRAQDEWARQRVTYEDLHLALCNAVVGTVSTHILTYIGTVCTHIMARGS